MGHEILQQAVLLNSEFYLHLLASGTAGVAVKHQIITYQLLDRVFPPSAQDGLDARLQFLKAEWFHQIVIRPRIEPFHDILRGAQCSQHYNRGEITVLLPIKPA